MKKLPQEHRESDETFIARGVREGWITPAKNPKGPLPRRNPVPGLTLEQLMRELDADREDRWPIPEKDWTPEFRALMRGAQKKGG